MTHIIYYQTTPTTSLQGELCVPGDKSISHRALILSAIAEGQSTIRGLLMGADNLATLRALQQLGVQIETTTEKSVVVYGVGLHGLQASSQVLNLGNSGTAIRLLTGLLAGQTFDSRLTGDASLCRRPMTRIVVPLIQMGAKIHMTDQGTPPLTIYGNQTLHGFEYSMPVASAQVKSCLLLAGLYAQGETTLKGLVHSRDHTERMLQTFGYPLLIDKNRITIEGGHQLKATTIDIPTDISSAAFFMVAAIITPGSHLLLNNVGINSTRCGIITLLKKMGANIEILNLRQQGREDVADINVCYSPLHGITIPEEQVPFAIDEFPILFIAAACAEGETVLHHAKELRVKETDRIAAMVEGLTTLGVSVKELSDGLIIQGGKMQGGTVESFGDHRVAMAFAIAGNVAEGPVTIRNCANVQTSFPNFVALASKVGIKIKSI